MASSGSVFSQTLQDITTLKLDELSKKRKTFEEQKSTAINNAQKESDAVDMLSTLASGVKTCFSVSVKSGKVVRGGTNNPRLETDLRNLDRFLEQARYDPSISPNILEQWQQLLLRHLNLQSCKYQYASLYGELTTEWLSSSQKSKSIDQGEDTEMTESFEQINSAAKLKARQQWEKAAFTPAQVDEAAINNLISDLFKGQEDGSKQALKAIEAFRLSVRDFEAQLATPGQFHRTTLTWAIEGLLASDLLTDEKREVLRDFKGNTTILSEIADVLNMRMTSLQSWSWGDHVPVEERRRVNGIYNIYMHEDLLQAIFLQFIGVKWSVFFKKAFLDFRRYKGVWKTAEKSISLLDRKRREYYLGPTEDQPSVSLKKQRIYRARYFVSQLLDRENQVVVTEEGEEEAEDEEDDEADHSAPTTGRGTGRGGAMRHRMVQTASQPRAQRMSVSTKAKRRAVDLQDINPFKVFSCTPAEADETLCEPDDNSSKPKNQMENKQNLLHLLSTDILIKTKFQGEITCFRSRIEDLFSTLPHATILRVVSFFGVTDKWTGFFKCFLQAPLKFLDDETLEPRLRQRGTPGAHVLSEVFGETVLFCLDYSINQTTDGEPLWRMNDDIWFWSPNQARCVKAWKAITEFTETMGLNLNRAKSGTVRILAKSENDSESIATINPSLPKGQIKWGMLYLDSKTGRFEIDQDMVDHHINELGHQLKDKEKSIFAWIQAWNSYATTFFTTNFGKPANCFGREHVDMMLATHERIQHEVFSLSDGTSREYVSPADFLKKTIQQRFEVEDVPDGYLFFPVELGGLELRSPFIGLLQIRDSLIKDPTKLLTKYCEDERDAYKDAKEAFEKGITHQYHDEMEDPKFKPTDPSTFMSFEEYSQYREHLHYDFDDNLSDVFSKLLARPSEESIDYDESMGDVKTALNSLGRQGALQQIQANWYAMEPYWKWVSMLYGPDMIERFGGFGIVDKGLLPIGMVTLFRSGRVKWQE